MTKLTNFDFHGVEEKHSFPITDCKYHISLHLFVEFIHSDVYKNLFQLTSETPCY